MSSVVSMWQNVVAGCALAVAAAACSKSQDTIRTPTAPSPATAAAQSANAEPNNLVAAVSLGKPGAPLSMQFELATKPKVGEPLEIHVVVTPETAGITSLQLLFQSNTDLQVKSGGELSIMAEPPQGEPIKHTVVVTPLRDGIYYLSAIAVAEGAGSQARTFSIPLVVGDSAALQVEKSAPPVDAKGQRVSSLPAAESGAKP